MRTAIAKVKEEEAGLQLALTAGLAVGFSKMLKGANEAVATWKDCLAKIKRVQAEI